MHVRLPFFDRDCARWKQSKEKLKCLYSYTERHTHWWIKLKEKMKTIILVCTQYVNIGHHLLIFSSFSEFILLFVSCLLYFDSLLPPIIFIVVVVIFIITRKNCCKRKSWKEKKIAKYKIRKYEERKKNIENIRKFHFLSFFCCLNTTFWKIFSVFGCVSQVLVMLFDFIWKVNIRSCIIWNEYMTDQQSNIRLYSV